jgi:hypothetical protein
MRNLIMVQTVGQLWACLAPNRQGHEHMVFHTTALAQNEAPFTMANKQMTSGGI